MPHAGAAGLARITFEDNTMRIAIPSEAPGGLDAPVSGHFGHCDVFTLVDLEGAAILGIRLVPNPGHEHGGCLGPVALLKNEGVTTMIAGGMGPRPLAGFQQVGIDVFFREDASTVREAVDGLVAGRLRQFGEAQTCGGHGGGCGSHAQAEPELVAVEEPIQEGHRVRFSYELREEGQDAPLDASEARYAHGSGQILPALERALGGHRTGDVFDVVLAGQEAFGARDEDAIVEVDARMLPAGVTPGDSVQMRMRDGSMLPMRVLSRDAEKALLDGNHPLAGKTVRFKVKVLEVAVERA